MRNLATFSLLGLALSGLAACGNSAPTSKSLPEGAESFQRINAPVKKPEKKSPAKPKRPAPREDDFEDETDFA
ncbi:MAG: hypothetical protein JST16_13210 [Bdellovibrionales bacterium]|nr:hypothetical protein [Bdellovibrionales bacterium]